MKKTTLLSALVLSGLLLCSPAVHAEQQPEMIAGKMAVKLCRGLINVLTSVVEIPRQTVLTKRDMGGAGYVIGPLKGIGMTFYRGLIGASEAAFFMVPQPGYYDPMIDPEYVWQGWEPKRDTTQVGQQPPEQ